MDNPGSDKGAGVRQAIEAAGAPLLTYRAAERMGTIHAARHYPRIVENKAAAFA